MRQHYRLLLLALHCSFLWAATAIAQEDDGGLLYFPPTLTVGVSTESYQEMRSEWGRSAPLPPTRSDLLVVTSSYQGTFFPLPMIFFDPGSYTIPERYRQFLSSDQISAYSDDEDLEGIKDYNDATMSRKYYEILDIFGYRLAESPSTTISLEGGYSTEPGENEEVGTERAQVVKEYLVNVWKIAPERIAILPSRRTCDSAANIFKQEEARRVFIHSDHSALFNSITYSGSFASFPQAFLCIDLDPRMPPQDIARINLVVRTEDEVLDSVEIPVHGNSTYQRVVFCALPLSTLNRTLSLSVQAEISTRNGDIRTSNTYVVPVTFIEDQEISEEILRSTEKELRKNRRERSIQSNRTQGKQQSSLIPVGHLFSFSIPFYETADTSLSALQKMWGAEWLNQIQKELDGDSTKQFRVEFIGDGGAEDIPGIRNEQLLSFSKAVHTARSFIDGGPLWPAILLCPPSQNQSPEEVEEEYRSFTDSLREVWGSAALESFNAIQEEWSKIVVEGNGRDSVREKATQFLLGRAEEVARYLRPGLSTRPTLTITTESSLHNRVWIITHPLPEERFYDRSVKISVSSASVSWSDEEDDFEEAIPSDEEETEE